MMAIFNKNLGCKKCKIRYSSICEDCHREALKKQAEEIREWLMDECDCTPKDCFIKSFDKRFLKTRI